MASTPPVQANMQHRRTKSSVLKSFIHKRTGSVGTVLPAAPTPNGLNNPSTYQHREPMFLLPADHPHSRALKELDGRPNERSNQAPQSPKKSRDEKRSKDSEGGSRPLHKKTLSSISLKALGGKEDGKSTKPKEQDLPSPKKNKSSTNLATFLSRPKSNKSLNKQAAEDEIRAQRDKENRTPPSSPEVVELRPTPIYAQFRRDSFQTQPNGGKFLEDEINRYTPREYSPGKQRNFYDDPSSQPTLTKRDESRRPSTLYLPSTFSLHDITRRVSNGSAKSASSDPEKKRRSSGGRWGSPFTSDSSEKSDSSLPTRGQRMLAAVSGLATRSKSSEAASGKGGSFLEDADVDREFEAMLDRRNIPEHQRGKMRNLTLLMKKDFIRQDWAETAAAKNKSGTGSSDSSADATVDTKDIPEAKPRRPRSRTFTLSRNSSKDRSVSGKKSRPDSTLGRMTRKKSSDSIASNKSSGSTGTPATNTSNAKAKTQLPDDFALYLKKVQKPELVEVGRLHKLRLLLRNETVAWTDEFIRQGGMVEIVGLLHRIMEVEWRFVTTSLEFR